MATTQIPFADLLQTAVTEPGTLSQAYSQFHNYSLGNVLLAAFQCAARGIPLGPLATFNRWKELGRHVKKGEKALTLCQPVTFKKTADSTDEAEAVIVRFVYRNQWFVLSQTDGQPLQAPDVPEWHKDHALATLAVTETPFTAISGNVMGYATGKTLAINPLNPHPIKTLFHELAHILLGHTAESGQADGDDTPRSLQEAEAEAVALLCCEALGLPGADLCRGYIQHWYGQGNPISERSAQRILRVADQVLRAGRCEPTSDDGGRP